jgi:hypothetical protein
MIPPIPPPKDEDYLQTLPNCARHYSIDDCEYIDETFQS